MLNTRNHRELALTFHRRLPAFIHSYLEARGIPDLAIHKYRLGWDGEHITIPITNREREVTFFRLASKPEGDGAPTDVRSSSGAYAELYGWERLVYDRDVLVICEGEFDRLILEGHGIPSVASTGGSDVFPKEWAKAFGKVKKLLTCFHNNENGRHDARQVTSLVPHALIAHLPDEVGRGGTIADFFLKLGKNRSDFMALLDAANPLSKELIPSPFV